MAGPLGTPPAEEGKPLSDPLRGVTAGSTPDELGGRAEREERVEGFLAGGGGGACLRTDPTGPRDRAGALVSGPDAGVLVPVGAGVAVMESGGSSVRPGGSMSSGGDGSGSVGLVALLLEVVLEKLTAEGEVKEADCREPRVGRREGGGAGAWTLTRRLEDRDRVESAEERLTCSCSLAGEPAAPGGLDFVVMDDLLSNLAWGVLRGGGVGFTEARGVSVALAVA